MIRTMLHPTVPENYSIDHTKTVDIVFEGQSNCTPVPTLPQNKFHIDQRLDCKTETMKVLAGRLYKSLLIVIFGTSNIYVRHKVKPRFHKRNDQQI